MIRVSNFLLFEFVVQERNKQCKESGEDDHLEKNSARENNDPENENGSHDEPVDDETNVQQENELTLVHEYQEYTQIELGTSMGRKKEKKQYYLYGVQVHYRLIQFLFVVSLSIIGMSFVLFWNTFIAEAIYGCDSEYDCFVYYTDSINYRPQQLITNCTDFKDNNISFSICFKLVFNFSEGIGNSGGFLFAMQVLVNLLVFVTIRVRKMKCNNACCRLTVKFGVLITIFILQLALTLVAPITFVITGLIVYKSFQRLYQFWTYIYMSFILLFVVPFVAIGTKNSKTNEQKSKLTMQLYYVCVQAPLLLVVCIQSCSNFPCL